MGEGAEKAVGGSLCLITSQVLSSDSLWMCTDPHAAAEALLFFLGTSRLILRIFEVSKNTGTEGQYVETH